MVKIAEVIVLEWEQYEDVMFKEIERNYVRLEKGLKNLRIKSKLCLE